MADNKLIIQYYNNIDSSAESIPLEITSSAIAASLTYSSTSYSFKVALSGMTFMKKIYEPNEVTAILSVNKDTDSTGIFPTADIIKRIFLGKPVEISIQDKCKGTNFFVYEIYPRYSNDTTNPLTLTLKIYSIDKLMTLDKYSQAYVGRKLRRELLGSIGRFSFDCEYYKASTVNETSETSYTKSKTTFKVELDDASEEKTITETITESGSTKTEEKTITEEQRKLQHLAYGNYMNNTRRFQCEFIHPYLVQYNETFYDFIVRVANRCGEFLYFDEGKLNIGLKLNPDSEEEFLDEYSNIKKKKCVVKEITATSITKYNTIELEHFTSGVFKVQDYSRNSLSSDLTINSEASTGNHSQESGGYSVNQIYKNSGDKHEVTYPSDTNFGKSSGYFYNSEIAHDEFFMPLYRDGFGGNTFIELNRGSEGKHIAHAIATVLNSKSLFDMLWSAGVEYAELGFLNLMYHDVMGKRGKERFIEPNSPTNTSNINGESFNKNPDVVVPASENEPSRWTTLGYYSDIKYYQDRQEHQMITIDMGEDLGSYKLGEIIKIPEFDSNYYVVTEVKTTVTEVKTTEIEGKTPVTSYSLKQTLRAIPLYEPLEAKYIAYPPTSGKEVFRKSGPQTAFVTDTADPKRQGRVKIRYPWQTKEDNIPTDPYLMIPAAETSVWNDYNKIRKEGATPWVRMTSPSASSGSGIYFEPEPGDEVLVNFENDNIERPYVIGSLYSKNHTSLSGKGRRVLVSKFGHMIRFKDPSDGVGEISDSTGLIRLMSSFSPLLSTASFWLSDYIPTISDSNIDKMTGGIDIGDAFGFYSISTSSDERTIKISSPLGDVSLNAFTGITISAPNGNITIAGKNIDITASNKVNITSGTNIKQKSWWESGLTGKDKTETALNWFGAAGRKVFEYVVSSIQPVDLGLLRSLMDVVIRPVNGTLSLKSFSFMKLEAGDGDAQIPRDAYTDLYKKNVIYSPSKENRVYNIHKAIANYINEIIQISNTMYNGYVTRINNLKQKIDGFLSMYVLNKAISISNKVQLIEKLYGNQSRPFTINDISIEFRNRIVPPPSPGLSPQLLLAALNSYLEDLDFYISKLNSDFEEIWNLINGNDGLRSFAVGTNHSSKVSETFKTINGSQLAEKLKKDIENEFNSSKEHIRIFTSLDTANETKIRLSCGIKSRHRVQIDSWQSVFKRSVLLELLKKFREYFYGYKINFDTTVDPRDDDAWRAAVAAFNIKLDSDVKSLDDMFEEEYKKFREGFNDGIYVWKDGNEGKGKILMSDNASQTLMPSATGKRFTHRTNEEDHDVLRLNDAIANIKRGLNQL